MPALGGVSFGTATAHRPSGRAVIPRLIYSNRLTTFFRRARLRAPILHSRFFGRRPPWQATSYWNSQFGSTTGGLTRVWNTTQYRSVTRCNAASVSASNSPSTEISRRISSTPTGVSLSTPRVPRRSRSPLASTVMSTSKPKFSATAWAVSCAQAASAPSRRSPEHAPLLGLPLPRGVSPRRSPDRYPRCRPGHRPAPTGRGQRDACGLRLLFVRRFQRILFGAQIDSRLGVVIRNVGLSRSLDWSGGTPRPDCRDGPRRGVR